MTPGARAQAAIECLDQWRTGLPVERVLTGWGRRARYAGSKDRRAVRDLVYDVLRQKGVCADLGGGETGRQLVLGLFRARGSDPAEVFTGQGYAPVGLGPAERALCDVAPVIDRSLDTPDWLRAPLRQSLGKDFGPVTDALALRAPVWLRVNTARASIDQAIAALATDGVAAIPDDHCPGALRIEAGAHRISSAGAYATGLVEPQDLSVQMAVALIDWQDGKVLDYCAGGGGKALAIAAATGQTVDVHDAQAARMADLPSRAARANADLRIVENPTDAYDIVLTDVPCSGSGTWRRDPEAKWRLTPEGLDRVLGLQSQILDQACALCRPGGRLIYMTCSFLTAENQDQIGMFLSRHPGWICRMSQSFKPLDASDGFFVAELICP